MKTPASKSNRPAMAHKATHKALTNKALTNTAMLVTTTVAFVVVALAGALLPATPAQAQGPSVFVFHGGGWGHGVGMSQNGARNMADLGHDHVAILDYYYPETVVVAAPPLGDIRVHIGDASRVEFASAAAMTFERNGVPVNALTSGSIEVKAHDGGLQVGSVWTHATATEPVIMSFPEPVKIVNNGHRYVWGKFQLTNRGGNVRVVEVLPMEDYVAGISEMPSAWPLEALMAQAIAARTYAHEVTLHRRASTEWANEYDISSTTVDQNYIGWDAQDGAWDKKWLAAVTATANVEIVNDAGPIRAYYSASNGGYTETANYVFGNAANATTAAPDPFDAGGHNWTEWTRSYAATAMTRWLNAHADTAVGDLQAINVLDGEGASARIDKATVELVGSAGTKRVSGKRLMVVMNAGIFGQGLGLDDHLPSTYVTIGNGASRGMPVPTGTASAPAIALESPGSSVEAPSSLAPVPGTGVAPLTDDQETAETPSAAATSPETSTSSAGFAPETIRPGTGVSPLASDGVPDQTAGVAPLRLDPGSASTDTTGTAGVDLIPDDESRVLPGTGVALEPAPSTGGGTAPTPADAGTVVPGTGVAPETQDRASSAIRSGLVSTDAVDGLILFVTRIDPDDPTVTAARPLAETEPLAIQARDRIQRVQTEATVAALAGLDIELHVAASGAEVAGVCAVTDLGVRCASMHAIRTLSD